MEINLKSVSDLDKNSSLQACDENISISDTTNTEKNRLQALATKEQQLKNEWTALWNSEFLESKKTINLFWTIIISIPFLLFVVILSIGKSITNETSRYDNIFGFLTAVFLMIGFICLFFLVNRKTREKIETFIKTNLQTKKHNKIQKQLSQVHINLTKIKMVSTSIETILTWQEQIEMLDTDIISKYDLNIDRKLYIYMANQIADCICANNRTIDELSNQIAMLDSSVKEINARVNKAICSQKQLIDSRLQQTIEQAEETFCSLSPVEFENFIAVLYEKMGYSCQLTPASGDYGIDILANKGEIRLGIQVKQYTNEVGVKAVQEVASGMMFYDCDYGCVVTSATNFTKAAYKMAEKLGIRLIAFNGLVELCRTTLNVDSPVTDKFEREATEQLNPDSVCSLKKSE